MAKAKAAEESGADTIPWLHAPREFKIALADGKLVCKNASGKQLASLPSWLKEEPIADQLLALSQWLDEHELQCQQTVERWMLRSLSVPASIAMQVWCDPAWRSAIENMIIVPVDAKGKQDSSKAGLLRDVDEKRGLGIVDLDGESKWLKSVAFAVPHPILIEDLADVRELASELNVQQKVEQLYRPVYQPTDDQKKSNSVNDFEGGKFEQLNYVLGHCRRLGYPVRGGSATCRVWEGDRPVDARYYVGDEAPESETYTGSLMFVDSNDRALMISDVGPVTFSEGVRMATAIYAKRAVEKEEGEAQ